MSTKFWPMFLMLFALLLVIAGIQVYKLVTWINSRQKRDPREVD